VEEEEPSPIGGSDEDWGEDGEEEDVWGRGGSAYGPASKKPALASIWEGEGEEEVVVRRGENQEEDEEEEVKEGGKKGEEGTEEGEVEESMQLFGKEGGEEGGREEEGEEETN